MKNTYKVIETRDEETGNLQYSVMREDGESWDNGIVALNFEHSQEGVIHALNCAKSLESKI